MRVPDEPSPHLLLQERMCHDEWAMLVCCMMLNQTSWKQVAQVTGEFFRRWPDARAASEADVEEMAEVIRPLGLYNRRSRMIVRMSRAYLAWDRKDPSGLPGVGKYARDSWTLFVKRELVLDVQDKELKKYVAWAVDKLGLNNQ